MKFSVSNQVVVSHKKQKSTMSGRGRGKPAAAASRTPTKAALKSTPKSAGKGRKTYVKVEEVDYEEVSI